MEVKEGNSSTSVTEYRATGLSVTSKWSLFYQHPPTWNSLGTPTSSGPAMEDPHCPIPWATVNA